MGFGEVILVSPPRRARTERLRRRRLFRLTFLFFLLIFMGRFEGLTSMVNRGIGPLLAAYALLLLRQEFFKLPREVYLYLAFGVGWAATGFIVAPNLTVFLTTYKLLIQLCILFLVVVGITWKFRGFQAISLAFAVAASGVMIYTLISGEMLGVVEAYRIGGGSTGSMQLAGEGLLGNANGFGFLMMVGIIGLVFVFDRLHSRLPQAIIVGWIVALGAGAILSASRKTFLSLLLFFLLWGALCHTRRVFSHPIRIMAGMLMLVILWVGIGFILKNTYLGERLGETKTASQLVRHEAKRRELYTEAWKIAGRQPLVGVGLGNFRVVSRLGLYAHSDFAEVLVDTGIVGCLLYASLFVVFGWRCLQVARFGRITAGRREAKYLLAVLIVFLLIGLGRPHFIQLFSMMWLGALVGHSKVLADAMAVSPQPRLRPFGVWMPKPEAGVPQAEGPNV